MIHIRQLTLEDVPELIAILKRDWYCRFVDFRCEDESLKKEFLKIINGDIDFENPQISYFGLFNENELLGYAKLAILTERAFLSGLFVNENQTEKGFEGLLLKTCVEKALEAGIHSMKVEVEDLNTSAISFYTQYGFSRQPNKLLYPSTGIYRHYNVAMISMDLHHSLNLLSAEDDPEDEFIQYSAASAA
ncbi:hypothetical protein Lbir_1891 [Legionella birminghamensis]|uniref:N-terminal acetyltransferase, GNAT family n=1 Tax=Legionella birminghamensis TaxID=28083 RepID=A0A378IBQ4_9GAMM|nr:GNAT family N-acetyltransferase [Legionella birminghamensis]KTC70116.1 hypothetical protein Lbir_1891 [Legionella birminghamensis]STX31991.1 N-terminal acetyltransferase, GNAT family [Legionella birminghamensis]